MKTRSLVTGAAASALIFGASAMPANAASGSHLSSSGRLATAAKAEAPNVAAASVSFRISGATCFSNGITFDARTAESGRSGVRQFKQTAQEQRFSGGSWVNITTKAVVKSARFPNDFRNFFFDRSWSASHPSDGASYRVKWQGFYLNGSGAVLAKTKVILINCF